MERRIAAGLWMVKARARKMKMEMKAGGCVVGGSKLQSPMTVMVASRVQEKERGRMVTGGILLLLLEGEAAGTLMR